MKSKLKMCITAFASALLCILCLCACVGDDDNPSPSVPNAYFYLHEIVSVEGDDGFITTSERETQFDISTRQVECYNYIGYELVGVFSQPNGAGVMYFDADGRRVSDAEIYKGEHAYAQYAPRNYALRLFVDDVVFKTINVRYGATISFFELPESKTGYDFDGWRQLRDGYDDNKIADAEGRVLEGKRAFDASAYFFDFSSRQPINIIAHYLPKKYDITFNYNGVKDNLTISAYHDSVLSLPSFDPIAGYEFICWSYVNSTADYVPYRGEKIEGELTLYAIFKRYKDFDIIDIDSGERLDTVRVYENERVFLDELDVSVTSGYEIVHWYRNESGGGAVMTELNYYDAGKAVYAELGAIQYVVELIVDDDVAVEGGTTRFTYTCERSLVLPTATREHCEFKGWCKDKNLATPPVMRIASGTTGNLKLYPFFKGESVSITLDAQNGEGEKIETREYGKAYALHVPTRIGYAFLGWFDATVGGVQYASDDGKSINPLDTVTPLKLYAQWEINRYTVKYVTSRGEILDSQAYEHGEILVLPTGEPQSGSLTFSGWYDSTEYKRQVTGGIKITADLTVYALFIDSKPVRTAADLRAIAQCPNDNYHLTGDINLGSEIWTPIDTFGGTLDGKGYKIHNFALSLTAAQVNFGFVNVNDGTIKNLTLDDFTYNVNIVVVDTNAGVIVGRNNGKISNCAVTNETAIETTAKLSVSKQNQTVNKNAYFKFGVLAGFNGGEIFGSKSQVKLNVNGRVDNSNGSYVQTACLLTKYGGIVAENANSGVIDFCYSDNTYGIHSRCAAYVGSYKDVISINNIYVGGIAASNENRGAKITNSFAKVDISNDFEIVKDKAAYGDLSRAFCNVFDIVGGVVGFNTADVSSCFATGAINSETCDATGRIGGVIGENTLDGSISNCYGNTTVTSISGVHDAGGFIGQNRGEITNCYSIGDVILCNNGNAAVGGFVGRQCDTGIVSGCFSLCNVSIASGTFIGGFTGYCELSLRKCYASDGVTLKVNGNIIYGDTGAVDGKGTVERKPESELISHEFLIGLLYWDDTVWTIDGDNRPALAWQA